LGLKDTVTIKYLEQSDVFADAFNYFLYDGKKLIHPEQLQEMDTTVVEVPFGEDNARMIMQPIQRIRDIYKRVMIYKTNDAVLMLTGIENQSDVHYAMPVKDGLYDFMEYAGQVQAAAKSHRKAEKKSDQGAEFLSGFYKRDRLIPVITLVIYWGAEDWDGPMSLHEMLKTDDEEILKYVPDYKINLICPAKMTDEDFKKFDTHLGSILRLVKCSGDPFMLKEIMMDDVYNHMNNDDAKVLKGLLQIDIGVDNGEEEKSVCKAVQQLEQMAAERAADVATMSARRNFAERLLRRGKMTLEEIAEDTGLTVEEVEEVDRRRTA